jgi:hypothetical protein
MSRRSSWQVGGLLVIITVVTLLGPAERTLGSAARIIYLHGALVWVAIMVFAIAALLGAAGLLARRLWLHDLSRVAGQVALIFWSGYLPLSMWAARATWGRVFLADPSFQRAFRILAVTVIVQVIIWLLPRPAWRVSALNLIPFSFLAFQLYRTQQFMHPESPIRNAESPLIQIYFYALSALCALLALAISRWLLTLNQARHEEVIP